MKVLVKAQKNEHGLYRGVIFNEAGDKVLATSLLEYSKAGTRKLEAGVHRFIASLPKELRDYCDKK